MYCKGKLSSKKNFSVKVHLMYELFLNNEKFPIHVLFSTPESLGRSRLFSMHIFTEQDIHVDITSRHAWHTKLAPAVLAAVKTEFSYVIIPHRNIGYIAIWIT